MTIEAYPLTWPQGWKRTQLRVRAKFVGKAGRPGEASGWKPKPALTIAQAVNRVRAELKRFGVGDSNIIISTNLQVRLDGLPRASQADPSDPGAAVYWTRSGDKGQRCMAIDRYDRVADNLAAIAATLDAMRAIERHGGATILDRAFAGFASLPAPEQPFHVLGVSANASKDEIDRAYKRLVAQHHPDRGGDEQTMARINAARDQLMAATAPNRGGEPLAD